MAISVNLVGHWPNSLRQAVNKVTTAFHRSGTAPEEGQINMKLVGDVAICELNKKYSGNAYATDVLTFQYDSHGELADIVISLDTAKRQATASGSALATEVALLALHGLLHAIGKDHQSGAGKRDMDQLQSKIMRQAGLTYREFSWA